MMREWFTASELAGLPGLPASERRVRSRVERENWQSRARAGRGGGNEYHLSALPECTQAALIVRERAAGTETSVGGVNSAVASAASGQLVAEASLPTPSLRQSEGLWRRTEQVSAARRADAERKLKLLDQVMALMTHGTKQRRAFELIGQASGEPWRTIESWYHGSRRKPGVRHYHRADWLAVLIDDYVGRTALADCADDAFEMFKADYLRLEKPGAMACYRRLQRAAEAQQWQVPSAMTLVRRIVREIPSTVRTLLRDGEEQLMKRYPAQQRSVRELHALEWINGDGYQHNVFVAFPDGTVDRPRTWFWQDVYSRKILAFRVDQTENSDLIRCALADVLTLGVPSHVTIDNTRAAANKWLTGGVPNRYRFKVKKDDPLGIFPMLGTQVHWTSVHNGRGHGQAKPVERSFGVGGMGEVVDKHPALAGAYTGANPMQKPENYGGRKVALSEFIDVLTQEIIAWNARPGRRTEICNGRLSFDDAFSASYAAAVIRKASEEQRRLCLLTAEMITVQRDGTFTLDAGKAIGEGRNRYGTLYEHVGERVMIKFDPQALQDGVYAYTKDAKFITECECLDRSGFGDTEESRAHARSRKQFIKATKLAAKAEVRMDAIAAARYLPAVDVPAPPEAKVVRPFAAFERKAPVAQMSDEQRAEHEAAVLEFYRAPEVIEDIRAVADQPMPLYAYWLWLDTTQREGTRELNEHDRAFYDFFPRSTDYKVGHEFFEEFPNVAPVDYLPTWLNQEKSRLKAG
jgi:putative transposase